MAVLQIDLNSAAELDIAAELFVKLAEVKRKSAEMLQAQNAAFQKEIGQQEAKMRDEIAEIKKTTKAKVAEVETAIAEEAVETPAQAVEKYEGVTLIEVREVLAQLSKDGKGAEVKALLAEYGAAKLTDLAAEKFTEIMTKAKEL